MPLSDEIFSDMASDGEGACSSSFVDDRMRLSSDGIRVPDNQENTYAGPSTTVVNNSDDPDVYVDDRIGPDRDYDINRWGRRVPKSPYPPPFRLADAMFMRPAPGVQLPTQEVPPGEKDWSKVKYMDLPGIPSGHRWHIRNPETGEVESATGSIMNDPVKPPMFIPWNVDRLPGRKPPNSDFRAKWATIETDDEDDTDDTGDTPLSPAALRRRSSARFRAQTKALWKIVPKKTKPENTATSSKAQGRYFTAIKIDSDSDDAKQAGNKLTIGNYANAVEELLKQSTKLREQEHQDWHREREHDRIQRRREREEDRVDRRRERDEDRKERQEEWKNFREALDRERERDLEDRREARKETTELFIKVLDKMNRLSRKSDNSSSDAGSATGASKFQGFGNDGHHQSSKQPVKDFEIKKGESTTDNDKEEKSPTMLNFLSGLRWGVANASNDDKRDSDNKSPFSKPLGESSFKNSEQPVDQGEPSKPTDDVDLTEANKGSMVGKKVSFSSDVFGVGDNDEAAKAKDGDQDADKDKTAGFGSSGFRLGGNWSSDKSGLARRAAEDSTRDDDVSLHPYSDNIDHDADEDKQDQSQGWSQVPPPPPGGDDIEGWKKNWTSDW